MTWPQIYDPANNLYLSGILAALPVLVLFFALAVRRLPGHLGGLLALTAAIVVAFAIWRLPMRLVLLSALYGAMFGLFPIGWIIVTALFLYQVTVETGRFEAIKASIARISQDRRLQALLIAFSFGAFLEGAAGFGAPVAIATAMLAGLGFEPFKAAGLSLLANTVPVAFAGFGIPLVTLAGVTGLELQRLSTMVGRQLPFLSVLIPVWLVVTVSGWRGLKGALPAVLASGISFAVTQWFTASHLGPYLPDLLSALVSTAALLLLLRIWQPAKVWRFAGEAPVEIPDASLSGGVVVRAWAPFLMLTVVIVLWNLPPVRAVLEAATIKFPLPGLHNAVIVIPPATAGRSPYPAIFAFNWLSTPGTALFLTAAASSLLLGLKPRQASRVFLSTAARLWSPLAFIVSVLALAFMMNYSGMSTALGLLFTGTGKAFPFFAPFLGWIGVFLTGSDTSSNALFGKLQTVAAQQVGLDPVLTAAANTSGGVTGKMISPQSIAVAAASANLAGREGRLFRWAFRRSLILVLLAGVIAILQAYVFRWMVP